MYYIKHDESKEGMITCQVGRETNKNKISNLTLSIWLHLIQDLYLLKAYVLVKTVLGCLGLLFTI